MRGLSPANAGAIPTFYFTLTSKYLTAYYDISSEMTEDTIYHRMAANITDTNLNKFEQGLLSQDDYNELIEQTYKKTSNIAIIDILDRAKFVSVEEIEALASDIVLLPRQSLL